MLWLYCVLSFIAGVFCVISAYEIARRKPEGRKGLILLPGKGYGLLDGRKFTARVVVEEIGTLGDQSKIKIKEISGVPRHLRYFVFDELGKYVPTNIVKWQESSQ